MNNGAARRYWEHFEHVADIGVRGVGPTPAAAFEQAAVALTAVLVPPERVMAREAVAIACRATDLELLLIEWLNALLFEMAVRHMLFARYEVSLADDALQATAWGERIAPERHQPAVEIKAATYAELRVEQGPDGLWLAQCVVDV